MPTQDIIPLWSDEDRRRQFLRLSKAPFRIAQTQPANAAREAVLALEQAPSDGRQPLDRVPRASSFDSVLQIFALAKSFDIDTLELSRGDFAKLTNLCESSVKRVFTALEAIGWLTTTKRFGLAVIDGVRQAVHRTAVRGLSLLANNFLFSGGRNKPAAAGKKTPQKKADRKPGKKNSTSSKGSKANQTTAAPKPQRATIEQPQQSAEDTREGLHEVAQRNPFLRLWVERGLAVV